MEWNYKWILTSYMFLILCIIYKGHIVSIVKKKKGSISKGTLNGFDVF